MLFIKAMNLLSNRNTNLLRMIINSLFRTANTERSITRNIRQTVRRNTEFTGAVVTFEL